MGSEFEEFEVSMVAKIQHAKLTGAKILREVYRADGQPDIEDLVSIANDSPDFVLYSLLAHSMTLSELKANELGLPVELYLDLLIERMENGPE